jgi:2-haloacid dehalogenase
VYCLRQERIEASDDDVLEFMNVWRELQPYEDALRGLERMEGRYRLVALSNGDAWLLEHLVSQNIGFAFDAVISVDAAGAFKPHPSVYRMAARRLGVEPASIMMVAAHSFDIMGARASGYRGAYVNRYGLPTEDSPHQPDLVVADFVELAVRLGEIRSQ